MLRVVKPSSARRWTRRVEKGRLRCEECISVVNRDHSPYLLRPLSCQITSKVAHHWLCSMVMSLWGRCRVIPSSCRATL
jgi:hypothetical protein